MVFSSPVFLFLFLPIVLALYFVSPMRLRNALLLAMSLFFYAWGETVHVFVMLGSITFNYLFIAATGPVRNKGWDRWLIAFAVAANLALFAYFKYAFFFIENLDTVFGWLGLPGVLDQLNAVRGWLGLAPTAFKEPAKHHLPIGISFFTFHAISYLIDVFRGKAPPLRNPIDFGLYIAFFPQLCAGPVVRYLDIADQLRHRTVTRDGFAEGVRRFLIGLSKKLIIANTLAVTVDAIYALPPDAVTPAMAWLAGAAWIVQLYFDFSGYSDMAIGLALMFGFRFKENFNYPYVAQTVSEFWRRWHISMSTWFRDYVYIPMGGSRVGRVRHSFNLLVIFWLCGLWHGASWAYIIWGLYQGLFVWMEKQGLEGVIARLPRPVRHLYVLVFHLVGCVFVRAADLKQALAMLAALFGLSAGWAVEHAAWPYMTNEVLLALALGAVGSTPWLPWLGIRYERWLASPASGRWRGVVRGGVAVARVGACVLLLYASAVWLAAGTNNPFIYTRF